MLPFSFNLHLHTLWFCDVVGLGYYKIYSSKNETLTHTANWDSDDGRALAELRAGFKKGKMVEEKAQMKVDSNAVVLEVEDSKTQSGTAPKNQVAKNKKDLKISLAAARSENESGLVKEKDGGGGGHEKLRGGQAYVVEEDEETRIIYPFEDGHREFYHAIEGPSKAVLPGIADKVESYIRRGWQEFFAALRILTGFFFIFVVELLLFLTRDTLYKLTAKIMVIFGNYLIKPLLSNLFNAIVQPVLVFMWNVFHGIRNMLEPVLDLLRHLSNQIATVLDGLRLVNVNVVLGGANNESRGLRSPEPYFDNGRV